MTIIRFIRWEPVRWRGRFGLFNKNGEVQGMMKKNIRVVVATHKQYQMPEDEMYLPLHVGAEGKYDDEGKPLDLGFVKDNTGDNISKKNPFFCELTGLYWAWKNSQCDYLGLAHYRRHFVYRKKTGNPFENVLQSDEAEKLFATYRVIVPKKRRYYIETLYSHYAHTHYAEHLDNTRKIIEKKCPQYLKAYDAVMKQTSGYMFNMMIMEKSLMDSYCTWLFDILFELEKTGNSQELSFFQGRFYGRVSELLFNVWLWYQIEKGALKKGDVKELACIYMEPVDWGRKISSFLRAKFVHKKYEGSF
jgi:hypothetical protein